MRQVFESPLPQVDGKSRLSGCLQVWELMRRAAEALSEAITIARDIGWEGGLSVTLNSMGNLKISLGDYGAAEELFQESIPTARRIKDRFTLARGLEGLGVCFRRRSNLKEAAASLEEAYLLWQELLQPWSAKDAASSLVDIKSSQSDWDGALIWHDCIIAMCRGQNDHWGLASHLEQKGAIFGNLRRYDETALHFEAAIMTRIENGTFWGLDRFQLTTIPKTVMKWERRLPLFCDLKKLQRRQPQLVTAKLKLPIPLGHGES